MRDPIRIGTILHYLRLHWEKNPDLRLGQIIVNLVKNTETVSCPEVFYFEDDALLEWLKHEV